MHLLAARASGIVESENRSLRPAITFGEQRHRQEEWRRGGGKSNSDVSIAVGAKAPFQSRADIAQTGKEGRPFRRVREGRPFCPGVLQPSTIVGCMALGQVGGLGFVVA